jgi:hypothetical protein
MTLPGGDGESGPKVEPANKAKQTGRLLGRGSSGSSAFVTMMKPTDLRDRDNRAGIGRLYVARFRAIFLQC